MPSSRTRDALRTVVEEGLEEEPAPSRPPRSPRPDRYPHHQVELRSRRRPSLGDGGSRRAGRSADPFRRLSGPTRLPRSVATPSAALSSATMQR